MQGDDDGDELEEPTPGPASIFKDQTPSATDTTATETAEAATSETRKTQ